MIAYELARYRVDPSNAGELMKRWPPAVEAIRKCFPGLVGAELARLDEQTWVDVWKWESREAAQVAAQGAPQVPEAAALFSLIAEPLSMEHADVVSQA
ncbi:MAG TPA: antibiotic biosynthesis monooxygenase [Actinomycetota bacterium]|nr:antibiotic biosynthesis monooxygenase [Actinomycetota bacterium]